MTDSGSYIAFRILGWVSIYALYKLIKYACKPSELPDVIKTKAELKINKADSNINHGLNRKQIQRINDELALSDPLVFSLVLWIKVKVLIAFMNGDKEKELKDRMEQVAPMLMKFPLVRKQFNTSLELLYSGNLDEFFKIFLKQLHLGRKLTLSKRVDVVEAAIKESLFSLEEITVIKAIRYLLVPEQLSHEKDAVNKSGRHVKLEDATCKLIKGYDLIKINSPKTAIYSQLMTYGLGNLLNDAELFDMCNEYKVGGSKELVINQPESILMKLN